MASEDYKVNLGIQFTGKDELNNIKTQIDSLTKSTHKIKFEVEKSGLKDVANEVKNITNNGNRNIKLSVDTSKLLSSLDKLSASIDNINTKLGSLGSTRTSGSGANNAVTQLQQGLNQLANINVNNTYQQISNMERALNNFGFDKSSINAVTKDLLNMNLEISKITTNLRQDGSIRLNIQGTDQLGRVVNSIKEVAQVAGADGSVFQTEIRNMGTTITQSFTTSADVAKQKTKEIESAYKELLATIREMGGLQTSIAKLDSTKDADLFANLSAQLEVAKINYDSLMKSFGSSFSPEQLKTINTELEKIAVNESNIQSHQNDVARNNAETQARTQALREQAEAEKELLNIDAQINQATISLSDLKTNGGSLENIAALETKLQELRATFESVRSSMSMPLSAETGSKLYTNMQQTADKLTEIENNYKSAQANIAQGIANSFNLGDYEAQVAKLESGFRNIISESTSLSTSLDYTKTSLIALGMAIKEGDPTEIISKYQIFQDALKQTGNEATILASKSKEQLEAEKQLVSIQKQIGKVQNTIGNLKSTGGNNNQIAELENKLQELEATFERVSASLKQPISGQTFDNIQREIKETEDALSMLEAKTADQVAKSASGITAKFNNGDFDSQLSALDSKLGNINNKTAELSGTVETAKSSFSALGVAIQEGDPAKIVTAYENYQNALKKASNEATVLLNKQKEQAKAEKELANAQKLTSDKAVFKQQLDQWREMYSAALPQFGVRIDEIEAKLASVDGRGLSNLRQELKLVTLEAQNAGVGMQTFGDRLKSQLSKLGIYVTGITAITKAMQALRSMYQQTLAVDTAMTELYRVTDLSSSQYATLYEKMTESAKEYGSTLDGLINSTASWVRLGFNENDSVRLAELTSTYQHVTDLDEETAVNNLVTAYKGFESQLLELTNGDATKAVEIVEDIYDKLGNEFAVTAGDVGEGLSKSASVLAQAGSSIQESAGMFTGINEVLQDASTSGSTLKILALRIRGMKGELQELGEDVDDDIDSISKMQTQILNLTHGKVNIFDAQGNFRNIYDIMKEISAIYDTLSDTEQASLLETIAGKNRANGVQALIDNWSQVEKATEAAYNSEGTAAEEQAKVMESLQGHLDQLKASWQELSADFLTSDFLKGAVDGLKLIVNLLDQLVKLFGTLGTVGAGIAVFEIFKNKNSILTILDSFKLIPQIIGQAGLSVQSLQFAFSDLTAFIGTTTGMLTVFSATAAVAGLAIQKYKRDRQKIAEARQKTIDESNSSYDNSSNITSLYGAYQEASEAYKNNKSAKEGLTSATHDLLSALGMEESEINNLINDYDGLNDKIDELANKSFAEAISKSLEGYKAAYDNVADSFGIGTDIWANIKKWANGGKTDVTWFEKDADLNKKIEGILKNQRLGDSEAFDFHGEVLVNSKYSYDIKSVDDAIDAYDNLSAKLKALDEAVVNGTLSTDEYQNSARVSALKEAITEYETTIGDVIEQRSQLNEAYANDIVFDNFKMNGVPKTVDDLNSLKSAMINAAENGDKFKGTAEDIQNAFESAFSNMTNYFPEFENMWNSLDTSSIVETQEEQLKKFADSLRNNDVKKWFDGLSDANKNLVYNIDIRSDDTQLWGLTKWEEELTNLQNGYLLTSEQMQKFQSIMSDDADNGLSKSIENYQEQIGSLQELLEKVNGGNLSSEDKLSILSDANFSSLAPYIDDTDALANAIQNLIDTSNQGIDDTIQSYIDGLGSSSPQAVEALEALRDALHSVYDTDWDFDFDKEAEKFNNLYSVINESVSATGLTSEAMSNIKSMFGGLESYDPSKLFERTSHGIHLNVTELRNLQQEYENTKKEDLSSHLQELQEEYAEVQSAIENCNDAQELSKNISKLNSLQSQITEVANLSAQYDGLTSSYNKWIQAQSTDNENDMYMKLSDSVKSTKELYEQGWVGQDDFLSAVQLMTDATVTGDNWSKYYEEGIKTQEKFFTGTTEGLENFVKTVEANQGDNNWITSYFDENGNKQYKIDFGVGGDAEVAKMISNMEGLEMSTEQVQALMRALSDAGFDINLDSLLTGVDDFGKTATEAKTRLEELQKTSEKEINISDINIDVSSVTEAETEITKAQKLVDQFRDKDGNIDLSVEGAEDALIVLTYLIDKKHELDAPEIMRVNVDAESATTDLEKATASMKALQDALNDYDSAITLGADTTEAQQNIQSIVSEINGIKDPDIRATLGLDDAEFQNAVTSIESTEVDVDAGVNLDPSALVTVQSTISGISPEMLVQAGLDSSLVDDYVPEEKDQDVKYGVDDSSVKSYKAPVKYGTVKYTATIQSWNVPTRYGSLVYKVTTQPQVNGTAHARGTAFAQGSWGVKRNETALVGE